jgi:hypothetical protein
VFKPKFNTPFAGVSSRKFYLGSLASQVSRFNLELAIEPGQDPEKPVGVAKNNLRQRFFSVLTKAELISMVPLAFRSMAKSHITEEHVTRILKAALSATQAAQEGRIQG